MNYNAIFSKYLKADATKKVEFSKLPNMDEKISALEDAGYTINEAEKYAICVTLKKRDEEEAYEFAARVKKTTDNKTAGAEVLQKNLSTWKTTIKKAGKDLGKAEKLEALEGLAKDKISGGVFEVEKFGGSNFVGFCNWLRGLPAEEFEKLTKTE